MLLPSMPAGRACLWHPPIKDPTCVLVRPEAHVDTAPGTLGTVTGTAVTIRVAAARPQNMLWWLLLCSAAGECVGHSLTGGVIGGRGTHLQLAPLKPSVSPARVSADHGPQARWALRASPFSAPTEAGKPAEYTNSTARRSTKRAAAQAEQEPQAHQCMSLHHNLTLAGGPALAAVICACSPKPNEITRVGTAKTWWQAPLGSLGA